MKCCELYAGKLRSSITVERAVSVADGQGGSSITWATYATIPAFVNPISGTERVYAMRLESTITHRIYIRYRDDLLTSDRITIGSRKFQIKAILNVEERNKWLEIDAVEGEAT